MSKVIAPDPDTVATREPQEVAGWGVFPVPLDGSGRTEAEWREAIKEHNLPLVVVDAKRSPFPSLDDRAAAARSAADESPPDQEEEEVTADGV